MPDHARTHTRTCRLAVRFLTFLLIIGFAFGGLTTAAVAAPTRSHHPRTAKHKPAQRRAAKHKRHGNGGDRIAAFVSAVQPRKGPRFARRVARAIRRSARATGIAPDVLLATGYVESEFRMGSGPCIGMMQVHPGTLREMRRRIPAARHLNPARIEDNIQLGALELAAHYRRTSAAAGKNVRVRRALGRYNGAGAGSGYVRRVSTVLRHLRKGDRDRWERHLKTRGPLWRA